MSYPLNQSHEPFMEANDRWDLPRLLLDLADAQGKKLTNTPQRLLRGALLSNPPRDIAKVCGYSRETVRQYFSKEILPAIRLLLNISESDTLVTTKIPLVLQEYRLERRSLPSTNSRIAVESQNNVGIQVEYEDLEVNYIFKTIEDIEDYLSDFFDLCKQENYIQAFYTVHNPDNSESSVYSFLDSIGYTERIVSIYEEFLDIWKPRRDEKWEFGVALSCLANAYQRLGRYDEALEKYDFALDISCDINDHAGEAGALINLGFGCYLSGKYTEGIDFNRKGIDVARQIGHKEIEGYGLNNLALIFGDLEEYHLALDYHYHALEIRRECPDLANTAASLINIGDTYRCIGNNQESYKLLCEGIDMAMKSQYREFEANGWFNLGLTLINLRKNSDAILAFQEAHDLFQSMHLDERAKDAHTLIQKIEETT